MGGEFDGYLYNKTNDGALTMLCSVAKYFHVICDVIAGPGERSFNAVSHKPKLTGTD